MSSEKKTFSSKQFGNYINSVNENGKKIRNWGKKRIDSLIFGGALFYLVLYPFLIILSLIPGIQSGYYLDFNVNLVLSEMVALELTLLFGLIARKYHLGQIAIGYALATIFGESIDRILRYPSDFRLAQMFWGLFALIGLITFLLLLFELFFGLLGDLLKLKTRIKNFIPNIKKVSISLWIILVIWLGAGSLYFSVNSKDYGHEIEIQPLDYDIEIRMWANYDPLYYQQHPYGVEMLDQMNRNGLIIQDMLFSIRDANNQSYSFSPSFSLYDAQRINETLSWYEENYPNIKFQFYAYGLGYGSVGNYEGSIYTPIMVKRFVDICRLYNFSNIIGIYTDWEGPSKTAPHYANMTRNGWHQALWTDAMAYAREYFPDWVFSCCYPLEMGYDPADGDSDLQYFYRYNIFMPMWDDYGPMVYRSCDTDPDAINPGEYDGSWTIYSQAYMLTHGTFASDPDKVSMWLGCTGCGPYNNNTIVYEHGKPMNFGDSTGFDALVRDILMLKSFGIKSVSIFLGNEQFENNNYNTGFFDQYGYADALDKLVERVNGENSTESFTIWSEGGHSWVEQSIVDEQLDWNNWGYIPIGFAFIAMYLLSVVLYYKYINNNLNLLKKSRRKVSDELSQGTAEENAQKN